MMNNNEDNVVKTHVDFFADAHGGLTDKSMKYGHNCCGITKGVNLKTRAIKNMLSERNLVQTTEAVCQLRNPARTGIWNTDGTFNEDVFDNLTSKYETIQGSNFQTKVITKKIMMNFLKEKYENSSENIGNACKVFYVIPVNWTRVTNGSINELFEYFADCFFNGEKALTIQRLRDFYTDPTELMKKRMKYLESDGEDMSEFFFRNK